MNFDIIVVKIGSSVLVQEDGELDYTRIANLVADLIAIESEQRKVVLVTSGAIASGQFKRIGLRAVPRKQRDQLYAAIGQLKLMKFYDEMFSRRGRTIGQMLLSRDAFASRTQYFSVRDTLRGLLANDCVPVVNDNDVLHQQTLGFSDNDQLAACVSGMLNASHVIYLTTPEGILDREGCIVGEVTTEDQFTPITELLRADHTGRGGMNSKMKACRLLFDLGIPSAIASGLSAGVIKGVLDGTGKCTRFSPGKNRHLTGVRKWLCTGAVPRGYVYVSEQGGDKLTAREQRGSLLATGVINVKGDFVEGDVICVCTVDGELLGYGITRLASEELRRMRLRDGVVVVHADYFYGTAFGFFE